MLLITTIGHLGVLGGSLGSLRRFRLKGGKKVESIDRKNNTENFFTGAHETTRLFEHILQSHWSDRLQCRLRTGRAMGQRSTPIAGLGTILFRHLAENSFRNRLKK